MADQQPWSSSNQNPPSTFITKAQQSSSNFPPVQQQLSSSSSSKLPHVVNEERNQVIFRKVRGILNKLTPEKFDKLGEQLIGLGLDSVPILKGVILLIFEKAIEEPKYSSMYAQLCKKLSRELSNFEQQQQHNSNTAAAGNNRNSPPLNSSSTSSSSSSATDNTFCRLLLIKCRDEFDNRLRASEKFREKLTTAAVLSAGNNNNNTGNGSNNNNPGAPAITVAAAAAGGINHSSNNSTNTTNTKRPVLTNLSSLSGNKNRSSGGTVLHKNNNTPAMAPAPTVASSQASSQAQVQQRKLTDEEEEQWTIAKSKMLGNIRFICELGRQGLVQENILHVCIKQLVSKRKEETIASKSEDLECLCQIMKTVGRLLDTEKARKLMDQYFERIIFYSTCQQLPSRIRFMLKDVIELREEKWQPRRVQRENGPRTIGQIREEAAKDLGIDPMSFWDTASLLQNMSLRSGGYLNGFLPPPPGAGGPFGAQNRLPLYGHPALPLVMNPGQRALDDMGYYANFGSNSFLGTGPGVIREDRHGGAVPPGTGGGPGRDGNQRRNQQQQPTDGGIIPNHQLQRQQQNSNPNSSSSASSSHVPGHMPYRGSSSQDDPRRQQNPGPGQMQHQRSNPSVSSAGGQNRNQSGNMSLPPRMMANAGPKMGTGYPQQQQQLPNPGPAMNQMPGSGGQVTRILQPPPVAKPGTMDNISLRPAQNSIVLKPQGVTANMVALNQKSGSSVGVSGKSSPVTVSDPGMTANGKPVSAAAVQEKAAPKENPKEVLLKKCIENMELMVTQKSSLKETMSKMRELKIPKNFQSDVLVSLIKSSLSRSDKDRDLVMKLLNSMRSENILSVGIFQKSFEGLMNEIAKLEVDDPLIKTHLSEFIGAFVCNKIFDLNQAFDLVGDKYPMFLLVLQRMNSVNGNNQQNQQNLCNLLENSKINLMSILPASDRNKEQLSDILEKRGLSFLQPLLKIELDLRKLFKSKDTSSPADVSKWISENVPEPLLMKKGFIFVLFSCLVRHIIHAAGNSNPNSGTKNSTADAEKELIKNYKSIMVKYTANKASLQLTALYALQSVCHEFSFPKGMILRWFNNLYDQEIIDEEIFLEWKEDINDEFPGKGQALFQVNAWLIWLETEADSEDEDDDEDDEDADSLSRK